MTYHQKIAAFTIVMMVWMTPLQAITTEDASDHTHRLWRLAAMEQATLEQSGIILREAILDDYLGSIVAHLWKNVHTDLPRPAIKVLMETRMDAFTYPNGCIFLTSGILSQIENEDQLAMIIAHEMAHYLHQDAVAFYDQFQTHFHDNGAPSADRTLAIDAKHQQQEIDAMEYQADNEGLAIITSAGYCQADVLGLISNLIKNLKGLPCPDALKGLANRQAVLETLINQDANGPCCASMTNGGTEKFHNRTAPAFIANAQIALRRGEWDQADQSVARYLALKPEDAHAYYLRGEIMRRRNDGDHKDRCIQFYEQALMIDPTFPPAYRALGELYFKAGRYRQAQPYFESFLELAPRDETHAYIEGYLRQCLN